MTRRVLIVCGSLQISSANRAVLDVVRAFLNRSRSVAVDIDDAEELGEIIAFSPDRESDPGDAVVSFRRRIAWADTVVFATLEYAGAQPGTFVERSARRYGSRRRTVRQRWRDDERLDQRPYVLVLRSGA